MTHSLFDGGTPIELPFTGVNVGTTTHTVHMQRFQFSELSQLCIFYNTTGSNMHMCMHTHIHKHIHMFLHILKCHVLIVYGFTLPP